MNINEEIMSVFTEKPKPKIKVYKLTSYPVVVATSWNPVTEELIIQVVDEPKG